MILVGDSFFSLFTKLWTTVRNTTIHLNLLGLDLSETSNCRSNSDSGSSAQTIGSSGDNLLAWLAIPNSYTGSLNRVLSTERTTESRMLRDLNLAHQLTEGGTITCSVLSCDTDLLCTLSHIELVWIPVGELMRKNWCQTKIQPMLKSRCLEWCRAFVWCLRQCRLIVS